MTFKEAYSFIEKASGYGSILGLETMTNLLAGLENPQDQLKFVHIAGTNGKGSTAAFITHILAAAGYRVGRYISPSVFSYEEKIQITYMDEVYEKKEHEKKSPIENVQNIQDIVKNKTIKTDYIKDTEIASFIERIQYVCQELVNSKKAHPTVFEIETAMAMLHFLQQSCDIVVLEVGLGGKLDATNVIKTTECGVITSISMDHMEYLGDTLEKIAMQKAGIIKPGISVVSYDLKPEAMKVIEETCKIQKSDLSKAQFSQIKNISMSLDGTRFDYNQRKGLTVKLHGKNQVYNAVVAILAAEALNRKGYVISDEAVREGLRLTNWSGRFEVISQNPLFIIDGAHNADAAFSLAENIKAYLKGRKIYFIMGVFKDKDYNEILDILKGLGEKIYTITPNNSRALASELLAEKALEKGFQAVDAKNIKRAVEMVMKEAASEDAVIAFGSLSYLFDIVSAVKNLKNFIS